MKKSVNYTHHEDRKYLADSKPFTVPNEPFTETDLNGLHELRRLLLLQSRGKEEVAQQRYEKKLRRFLSYRYKATAQEMIDFEVDVMKLVVEQPKTQQSVDSIHFMLEDWFVTAAMERLNKLA